MCNPGSSIQNFLKHFLGTSLAWHSTKYYKTFFFLNRKLFPRWLLVLVRVSTKTGRFLQLLWFNLPTNLGSLCPPSKKTLYVCIYTYCRVTYQNLIMSSFSSLAPTLLWHRVQKQDVFSLHYHLFNSKTFLPLTGFVDKKKRYWVIVLGHVCFNVLGSQN